MILLMAQKHTMLQQAPSSLDEVLATLRAVQPELRARFRAEIIGVFGSYARGEQTPESDIDLLVELEKPIGLRFFELWDYLESILGTRVDLLTPGALRRKPRLQQRIQKELVHV